MTTPRVTIGLPVYNGERHLRGAIEAVLGQTFTDLELVISDNGSTDATPDIVAEAAAADDRVRSYRVEENRGASWNFNIVLHHARAPLFKWASHDDEMRPTMIERCVAAADADRDAVLWYPLAAEIDDAGDVVGDLEDRLPLSQATPHERLRQLLETYVGSNPIFGVLDTATLRSTRQLDDFHSSDIVLLGELALLGRFVEIDERLFLRRWEYRSTHSRTHAEVEEWFNPETRRIHHLRRTRLFGEMARSIARAPIDRGEKARCMRALLATWGRRDWRVIGGELKLAARHVAATRSGVDAG